MRLTAISRPRALIALALTTGMLLGAHAGLGASDLLCLAPALLIAATLLGRRYPGERLLRSLAAHRSARRQHPVGCARPWLPLPRSRVPRGGLLIAFALAVRPPPRAALMPS